MSICSTALCRIFDVILIGYKMAHLLIVLLRILQRGRYCALLGLASILHLPAHAIEGMWLPHLLKALNEAEMQQMGLKIPAEAIYSVNSGSLKDAIVRFGGGCTGSIISPYGLLLTNHHCGYSFIQSHSTVENNRLKDGFWAQSMSEELPNPGLTATFIRRIVDVTDIVLSGVLPDMDERTKNAQIQKNIQLARDNIPLEPHEDVQVKAFFHGLQYLAIVTMTFRDVRLVAAPPESIGKFGGDTDNWVWPRHTGDFSLFRIYADSNNQPSDYSPDNRPYRAPVHLKINTKGIREGDFTMVFGFPGRTHSYLPSIAIQQIIETIDPARIEVRDSSLAVMQKYMRKSEAMRLKYASRHARIANYWKKWIGEREGLIRTKAVAKKQALEHSWTKKVQSNPALRQKYSYILPRFQALYDSIEAYHLARELYYEVFGWNSELMRFLHSLRRLVQLRDDSAAFRQYQKRLDTRVRAFWKNYDPYIDMEIFEAIFPVYLKHMPPELLSPPVRIVYYEEKWTPKEISEMFYYRTILTDSMAFMQLWDTDVYALVDTLQKELAYQLFEVNRDFFFDEVEPQYRELKAKIDEVQKDYMRSLMEVFPEKRFYPDANGTLRLSYGKVESYRSLDSVEYPVFTYIDGVISKYIPGDYEFDLPHRLIELYEQRDFGPYTDEQGRLPVCFIGSNHTTGGNSGSPALDGHGYLVGLNFDRVWEGTMSDYNYDIRLCRNIMVDIRYILFLIDKFGQCPRLIREMTLIDNP